MFKKSTENVANYLLIQFPKVSLSLNHSDTLHPLNGTMKLVSLNTHAINLHKFLKQDFIEK